MAELVIEARNLTKRFRPDALALEDLSFTVSGGEIYCLLGPTGAGKTTTVDLFLGDLLPTSGTARVQETICAEDPAAARRRAVFVTRRARGYGTLTMRQNVEFFARMAGTPRVDRRAVDNALRRAAVAERDFDRPVDALPKSAVTFLWVAVAVLRDTPALIWDDPTVGLEGRAIAELHECLWQLRAEGKAILVATADVAFGSQVGDRVGVLRAGQKIAEHTPSQLADLTMANFYGEWEGRLSPTARPPAIPRTR